MLLAAALALALARGARAQATYEGMRSWLKDVLETPVPVASEDDAPDELRDLLAPTLRGLTFGEHAPVALRRLQEAMASGAAAADGGDGG